MNFDEVVREFRAGFPDGGLSRCDVRPHFAGFLVNACSTILPSQSEADTRVAALELLAEIIHWLRPRAGALGAGDTLQIVVGWHESVRTTGRQILKCWLPAAGLAKFRGLDFASAGGGFGELDGWANGIAWPGPP
jgi:hypothetical protein